MNNSKSISRIELKNTILQTDGEDIALMERSHTPLDDQFNQEDMTKQLHPDNMRE